MVLKINGEQPFQVLNTNFSIGPSTSGYDLYFSANGKDYSKLFTVAANTNRQVTQVAAGSYYILSGNTDSAVTVNWIANCYNGGEGGGSYTLPVASEDTLGGIKVGSGLTIDSGGTLNANPGGYTLPAATDSTLGGVKIGSGITVDSAGTISVEAQSGGSSEDWTWYSMAEYQDMSQSDKNALFEEMAALYSAGTYTFGFLMDTEDGVPVQYPVWKYEEDVQKLWFRAVYARCYDDDPDNEMGYAAVNASVLIIEYGEEDKYLDWASDYSYATEDYAGVVKVGSGLTIDNSSNKLSVDIGEGLAFSGNTLVVSGGSGNYDITDSLPSGSTEGKTTFVRTSTEVLSGITIEITDPDFNEGYLGYIYTDSEAEEPLNAIYFSSNNFYWDWAEDSWDELHYKTVEQNGDYYTYAWMKNSASPGDKPTFSFFPLDSGCEFRLYNGDYDTSESAATGETTYDLIHYGKTYVWINSAWTLTGFINYSDIEMMSNEDRADLFNEIKNTIDAGRNFRIRYDREGLNNMLEYSWYNANGEREEHYEDFLVFYGERSNIAKQIWLGSEGYLGMDSWEVVGINWNVIMGGYDSGGTNGSDMGPLTDGGIEASIYRYAFRFPNPDNPDEYLGLGLINFWYKYKVEADNDEGWQWYYVVGGDFPVETTIYHGVWGFIDNEHIETLQWTSGSTYESQTYTKYVPQP